MISAILSAIAVILGTVVDLVTLPFRVLFALLSGSEWKFRRFSRVGHRI